MGAEGISEAELDRLRARLMNALVPGLTLRDRAAWPRCGRNGPKGLRGATLSCLPTLSSRPQVELSSHLAVYELVLADNGTAVTTRRNARGAELARSAYRGAARVPPRPW
jgi:hypothetical protein